MIPPSPKVVFNEIDMTRAAGVSSPYNLLIAGTSPKGRLTPMTFSSPDAFVKEYGYDSESNFYWAGNYITAYGTVLAVRAVGAAARHGGVIFNVDQHASGQSPTTPITAGVVDPEAVTVTDPDELFHVYSNSPGAWCNADTDYTIKVAVITYDDYNLVNYRVNNPPLAAGEFLLIVTDSAGNQLEYFRVSRDNTKRDSYGSMYICDRVNAASSYIYVVDNKTIDKSESPVSTITGTTVDTVNLSHGVDDNAVTSGDILDAYNKCKNTSLYSFVGILSIGNVGSMTDVAIPTGLISLADETRTRVYLDNPFDVTTVAQMIDYRETHLNCSSSRAALYFDWQEGYDTVLDKYRWLPPTIFVGTAIARMCRDGKPFFAPAGDQYGVILNSTRARFDPEEGDRDQLYSYQVNPLATVRGLGRRIWGDKTQQKYRSSLSYIGCRTSLDMIEDAVEQAGLSILFMPNNTTTREIFADAVNPYLRQMYAESGLASYIPIDVSDAIQTSEEVLNAILKVDLQESVQAITIQVQIVRGQNVSISEL